MQFEVGASEEIITPKIGAMLTGFWPGRPCESINDDLTVTAAVFHQGKETVVLLAATILDISFGLTAELQKSISDDLGISPSHVVISASHTHSGPNFKDTGVYGPLDTEYIEGVFKPRCLKAAKDAFKNLRPVKIGIGETESSVGINRRKVLKDGSIILAQNPWGVFDPCMTVISFTGIDGSPCLNMIHYGAHANGAGKNKEVTRDWPGVMTDRLKKETGALTMFLLGSEGDVAARIAINGQDSYAADRSIAQTIELGGLAGIDAARAWRNIKEYRDMDLKTAEGDIRIPYAPLWPLETVREKLAEGKESRQNFTLKAIETLYEKGETDPGFFEFHQTLFRIGPIVFVPFPFEVFSEIFLRLRDYSPFPYTLSLGLCNGSSSYLPTKRELAGGGYEAGCFFWNNPRRLPDDMDTRIINENLNIIKAL
jgi:hypothetical protein